MSSNTRPSVHGTASRVGGARWQTFPGFRRLQVETSEATICAVTGGSGPPLLLLHGWPQSHLVWRNVAPILAEHFTVVATDLRGYAGSSKPDDGLNHETYSKRRMAKDQIEVMRQLGHERFQLVGHDRGGRVAHRLALDYPDSVSAMAVIDIVPTLKIFTSLTKEFAAVYSHWLFMLEAAPIPETLYINSADFYLRTKWFRGLIPECISEDIYAEYLRYFKDPKIMHAMCEDYRAAATIDLDHDRSDLDKKVACPLLALWGKDGAMERYFDVCAAWRERAVNVRGKALAGGHWLPEQHPEVIAEELLEFLLQN